MHVNLREISISILKYENEKFLNTYDKSMYFRVRCDTGFTGASCQPRRRIEETMQADFGIRYEPDSDFVDIWGGEVIGGDKGCGTLLSGETLYFSDVSSPN